MRWALHKSDLAYLAGETSGVGAIVLGVLADTQVSTAINTTFHTTVATPIAGVATLLTLIGSKVLRIKTNPAGMVPVTVTPPPRPMLFPINPGTTVRTPDSTAMPGRIAAATSEGTPPMASLSLSNLTDDFQFALTLAQAIASVEAGTPKTLTMPVNIPAETLTFEAGPLGKLTVATAAFSAAIVVTITKD